MQTTSQVLADGARNFTVRLSAVQDGTGVQQTLVKVIDVSAMDPPSGPSFKIVRIDFRVLGGIVELLWEAPAPELFAELQLADHAAGPSGSGDGHAYRAYGWAETGTETALSLLRKQTRPALLLGAHRHPNRSEG